MNLASYLNRDDVVMLTLYMPLAESSRQQAAEIRVKLPCRGCGKAGKATQRCGSCNNEWYCSEACQEKDWPCHKQECTHSQPAAAAAPTEPTPAAAQPNASEPNRSCRACAARDVSLKKCSVCLAVRYCSAACQKADWRRHKGECQPAAAVADAAE